MTKILPEDAARFALLLANETADNMDNVLLAAHDDLENAGAAKAAMILDGMRAGILQAQEASHGARVVSIWWDDNSTRSVFSWSAFEGASDDQMFSAVTHAIASALRPNGDDNT